MGGYVYIVANRKNGALYTGVTADIAQRVWQHRNRTGSRFATKHEIFHLVYVEFTRRSRTQSSVKNGSRSGAEHGRSR